MNRKETQAPRSTTSPDTLVVFGEDWGAHPSSTQHIINGLRSRYRILWVNSIGLRRPRFSIADIKRICRKGSLMFGAVSARGPSRRTPFPVIHPKAIPWPGNPVARALNGVLLRKSLEPYLAESEHPILWISLPSAVDVAGKLNEKAIVYYCGDDFSSLEGVDHEAVSAMEEELARKAGLILVASRVLAGKFPGDKTHVIPHGVDFELFSTPQPPPDDLPRLKPMAGFYGSIAGWIDQDLLAACARELPEWNFILIGPVKVDVSRLRRYENIHFLGPRDHGRLPGYLQQWRAAMLPFRRTAQIAASNPLKLREYLASGSRVVAMDFPALDDYRDVVAVASSHAEFIQAIRDTPSSDGINSEGQRRVSGESWSRRAHDVGVLLDTL